MVLLSPSADRVCCKEFEADVYVLFHCNKITKNFQTTVHIGTVCQTAFISEINKVSNEYKYVLNCNLNQMFALMFWFNSVQVLG